MSTVLNQYRDSARENLKLYMFEDFCYLPFDRCKLCNLFRFIYLDLKTVRTVETMCIVCSLTRN